MRLFTLLALLALSACCHQGVTTYPDAHAMFDATVVVKQANAYCAGALVNNRLLTAAHCIKDVTSDVQIMFFDQYDALRNVPTAWSTGEVVGFHPEYDLAVITYDTEVPHGEFILAAEAPEAGTAVYAIGHPHEYGYTFTEGRVVWKRRGPIGDVLDTWMQHTAEVRPGMSGGPLITEEGYLIGINLFRLSVNDVSRHSGAAPLHTLKEVLEVE